MLHSTNPQRQLVNHLMQSHTGVPAQKFRPQALRAFAKLENGKSSITFDIANVLKVSNLDAPSIVLGKNDVFVLSHMAFMLVKVKKDAKKSYFGNARAFSYPDRKVFDSAAVSGGVMTEAECLEAIYNGTLEFKTGNYTRLSPFPMSYFRITPETQMSADTEPSIPGFVSRETILNYYLSGQQTHEITVNYPKSCDTSNLEGDDADFENYVVFYGWGVNIVDGAQSPELLQIATSAE